MAAFENMVNYARTYLYSFEEKELNEVDSLIFCWLSYFNIHEDFSNSFSKEGMPITELLKAEYFEEMFTRVWDVKNSFDLLVAVLASPRFRNIRIRYYRDEKDDRINLQFSALVFSISDTFHYVAYRGTDWSITGWKEDLLLAVQEPVGAQKMAISYLDSVGDVLPGELIIGGHSKGGNLAVFAGLHCKQEICDRLKMIYSHDGPGFLKEQLAIERYVQIKDRIRKTIPEASYVGMLFQSEAEPKVIDSNGASVMQHLPFTWRVEGDHLYESKARSFVSASTVTILNKWIESMSDIQRVNYVEAVFDLLDDLKIEHIDDIKLTSLSFISRVTNSIRTMAPENRKIMLKALRILVFGSKEPIETEVNADALAWSQNVEKELEAFNQEYSLYISKKAK